MQITATTKSGAIASDEVFAKISHRGEDIFFSVRYIVSKSQLIKFDVFEHLTAFWKQLSESEQDAIFQLYKDILDIFIGSDSYANNPAYSLVMLQQTISEKCREILNIQNYERVHRWVAIKSNLSAPSDFSDVYVEKLEENKSRDLTYTKGEYVELLALSVLFKSVVPIFGEFINNTQKLVANHHKELYAFSMVEGSDVLSSAAFAKFAKYVETKVKDAGYRTETSLTEAISSEDYSMWMISSVVVRRLSVSDIRGEDPNIHLLSCIHKFVKEQTQPEHDQGPLIREKMHDGGRGDSESEISTLENVKVKLDLSIGSIVEMEYVVSNPYQVAEILCPEVARDELDKSLTTARNLLARELHLGPLTILQWMVKPIVPPQAVDYYKKETIINLLGVVEAMLWHRGHRFLAAWLTSYPDLKELDFIAERLSRRQLEAPLAFKLRELFPHYPIVGGKVSKGKKYKDEHIDSVAVGTINYLASGMEEERWITTIAKEKYQTIFGASGTRRLPIDPDFQNHLARLIIEIAQ